MDQLESLLGKDIIHYVEDIVELLSPRVWQNILLDCTKNELLVLWLLFRNPQVNMTQVAEYIHVPLNTATGIIARMEKRELVQRERSSEDKRIVTICMGIQGNSQMQAVIKEFMYYGQKILESFTAEEIILLGKMMDKLSTVLREDRQKERPVKTVRRISIE